MTGLTDQNPNDIFSESSSAILGTSNKQRLFTNIKDDEVIVVSVDNPSKELVRTSVKTAYERISAAAILTRQRLNDIYKQHQVQSQSWFRASIIAAIIGFLVIVIGLISILAGFVNAGLVSSAVGIISEVVSALFYKQANIANSQLRSDVIKLVDAERVHQAIELALTVEDQKLRDELKASIIKLVLQNKSNA